jgi:acetolactate synthase-1/2/3 large subunit
MPRVIDLVIDTVIEAGIDHAFGLPGGVTPFLLQAFYQRKDEIRTIIARQEGMAATMADMYGRLTGKPGLLIGQGIWIATNGAFGIVESFLGGVPMVIITEISDLDNLSQQAPYQCGSGEYGTVNIQNIFRSMTKYTTYATTPVEVVYGVQLAIKHAISGRPGPACVVTRWNSLGGNIDDPAALSPPLYPVEGYLRVSPPCISDTDAKKIAKMLLEANNPIMICGRGVHASKAYQEVQEIAELIGMPVTTSYMGKSSLPDTHDLSLGVMASRGQKLASDFIKRSDFILAVGTCLAPDNTNSCSPDLINPNNQKIIQIDIDPRNAGWTYPITLGVTSDAKLALRSIINSIKTIGPPSEVQKTIDEIKSEKENPENEFFISKFYFSDKEPIEPERVVKEMNELFRENDLLVLDAGNNRVWFTKLFKSKKAGQVIAPGGAAGMGYSAGASICAAMLHKAGKVIQIIGDGSLLMTLGAIDMAREFNLPLVYVVLNNSSLGNVRDFLSRKGRPLMDYPETNFADIAKAMGIQGVRVEGVSEIKPAFEKALNSEGPFLLDVIVSKASHLRIRSSL